MIHIEDEITIDKATFLVSFHGLSIRGQFIFNTPEQLEHYISKYNKYGIQNVQELDLKDLRFKRVSKIRLQTLWGFHTRAMIILRNMNYF